MVGSYSSSGFVIVKCGYQLPDTPDIYIYIYGLSGAFKRQHNKGVHLYVAW